jgi:vacuolar protein sorting-associated protein 26
MDFLFGSACNIVVRFAEEDKQPVVARAGVDEKRELLPLFVGDEKVAGSVVVDIGGKPLNHLGIKIELVGQIELLYDRGNPHQFTPLLIRALEPAGILNDNKTFAFDFLNCSKEFETIRGNNVTLRYFIKVQITRQYASNIVCYRDFAVQNITSPPDCNTSIKMEVGIEDCLHIEFEYNKSKYDLEGVVIGKIYFLLVRIKIKHMEIVIIKRESTGTGADAYHENENLAKFEIMDGAPVRGESIPVRLFLSPYRLTPTMKAVHGLFSVKYFLNLVLVDEEDRRYFKQQEIFLYRKRPATTSS